MARQGRDDPKDDVRIENLGVRGDLVRHSADKLFGASMGKVRCLTF